MPDTAFYKKLTEVCNDLGMNPRDLLLVMWMESGVDPANPAGGQNGARGLIQFEPDTLRSMKVSEHDIDTFRGKSGIEQLDYVKRFIQTMQNAHNGGRPFGSATKYYCCNFYPATMYRWKGDDIMQNLNTIVVNSNANNQNERKAYRDNKILDVDHDGVITVGDIARMLAARSNDGGFQNMLATLNTVAGPGTVSERFKIKKHTPHRAPSQLQQEQPQSSHMQEFLHKINDMLDSLMSSANDKSNNIIKLAIKKELDLLSKTVQLENKRITSSNIVALSDCFSDIINRKD
jgi:hypothetical protein